MVVALVVMVAQPVEAGFIIQLLGLKLGNLAMAPAQAAPVAVAAVAVMAVMAVEGWAYLVLAHLAQADQAPQWVEVGQVVLMVLVAVVAHMVAALPLAAPVVPAQVAAPLESYGALVELTQVKRHKMHCNRMACTH